MADESMIYASLEDYKIKISELRAELETLTIGSQQYNSTLLELNNTTKEMSEKTETAKIAALSLKDNFADVATQITGSASSMGGAIGGVAPEISKLGTAWSSLTKLFMSNPWVAALTIALGALMTIIKKVSNAIKGNEQTSNKWSKAMATFRPFIDAVSNAFDWLAGVFVDVVSVITDNLPKIVRNIGAGAKKILDILGGIIDVLLFIPKTISQALAEYMPKIMDVITAPLRGLQKALDAVGADEWAAKLGRAADSAKNFMSGMSKSVADFMANAGNYVKDLGTKIDNSMNSMASKMERAQKMQERQNKLAKREREVNEQIAQSEVEIGKIRNKVAKETDPKKRIELLKQQAEIEKKNGETQKKLLNDKLKLAKEYASLTANSRKDNEQLSQMQVAVSKAEAATLKATESIERRITRSQNKINSQAEKHSKEAENRAEKAQKDAERRAQEAEKLAKETSKQIVSDLNDTLKELKNKEEFELIDPNREKENLEALGHFTAEEQIKYLKQTHTIQQKYIDERINAYNEALKNEKLGEKEKTALAISLADLTVENIKQQAHYDNELTKLKIKNIKEVRDAALKSASTEKTDANSQENDRYANELNILNSQYENGEIAYEEYLKKLENAKSQHEQILFNIQSEENLKRQDALKQYWEDTKAQFGENSLEALNAYSAYEKAKTDETLRETNNRIDLNKKEQEANKRTYADKIKNLKNNIKIATQLSRSVSNVMGTVSEIMQQNIEEKVKRGEITEEEAEKEFESVKKLQIAEAIINTLTGALQAQMSVWAPGSGITSVWAKIAMSAALGIQTLAAGYAQVQKIKSTTFGGGGGGASQPTIITGAATPLLNEAKDINNLNAMNVSTEQPDQRVYVLETDITNAQNRNKVRVSESTF